MAVVCAGRPEFGPDDKAVVFVPHPPDIEPGTNVSIFSAKTGSLYAVQLPGGRLYHWLAAGELMPVDTRGGMRGRRPLEPGRFARVAFTEGHPSAVKEGAVVRIIQEVESVPFYDVMIDGSYRRWLAEFEIAPRFAVGRFISV